MNYSVMEIHEECNNPISILADLLIQGKTIREVRYINKNILTMIDENNIIYYLYGK